MIQKIIEELQNEANRWRESAKEYDDDKEYGHAQGLEDAIRIIRSEVKKI